MNNRGKRVVGPGLFVGMWVTTLGVIFLLDQLGIFPAREAFHFVWPAILIVAGTALLFSTTSGNRFWGAILLTWGLVSVSNELGILHVRVGSLWPLFLIAVGLWMLFNSSGRFGPGSGWPGHPGWRQHFRESMRSGRDDMHGIGAPPTTHADFAAGPSAQTPADPGAAPSGAQPGAPGGTQAGFAPNYSPSDEPEFDQSVVFSGFKRRVTSQRFRFGKVAAVFGGCNIDFSRADIDGDYAVLHIDAIFGGGEVRVPDNWRISIEGHAIAGAFVDETYGNPDPSKPIKTLIVRGAVVFGGVSFKS